MAVRSGGEGVVVAVAVASFTGVVHVHWGHIAIRVVATFSSRPRGAVVGSGGGAVAGGGAGLGRLDREGIDKLNGKGRGGIKPNDRMPTKGAPATPAKRPARRRAWPSCEDAP